MVEQWYSSMGVRKHTTTMASSAHSPILLAARDLVAGGISVIPWQSGTKEPAYERLPAVWNAAEGRSKVSWTPFAERLPTDEELVQWFGDGAVNADVLLVVTHS